MKTLTVASFVDFINEMEMFEIYVTHVLFRGQPVKGNLLPSVARIDPNLDTTIMEKSILRQLRLQGASLLPNVNEGLLDVLVKAQHFGLKTRLLDWTSKLHHDSCSTDKRIVRKSNINSSNYFLNAASNSSADKSSINAHRLTSGSFP